MFPLFKLNGDHQTFETSLETSHIPQKAYDFGASCLFTVGGLGVPLKIKEIESRARNVTISPNIFRPSASYRIAQF